MLLQVLAKSHQNYTNAHNLFPFTVTCNFQNSVTDIKDILLYVDGFMIWKIHSMEKDT